MRIIKEKRKTITLKVDKNWEVILKTPEFVWKDFINNFLEKHKDWILKQKNKIFENKINFKIWEKFLLFWEYFKLIFDEEKKFYFDWKYFYSCFSDEEKLKKEFIKFYKKEAKKYISERILEFCNILQIDFNFLKITSASKKWWSCSSKKNINFSYKLILAPKKSIDYVIIHELSHLNEMNHWQNFWNLVEKYSNILWLWDYKENQKWLKENNLITNF